MVKRGMPQKSLVDHKIEFIVFDNFDTSKFKRFESSKLMSFALNSFKSFFVEIPK